jgi:hypothetical protein
MEKQKQQKQNVLPNAATDYSNTSGSFNSVLETDLIETVAGLLGKLF